MDIYKADGRTLNTEKLCFLMWEKQNDPTVVDLLTETLSKSLNEKAVFDDIEFFIPQIAHMSIHLTDPSVLMALEKLTVVTCVTSAHLALQLYFIYMAAMEDFQPENNDGMKNPGSDAKLYSRCSQLLQDVERSFIYGSVVDKPQKDDVVKSGHVKQQSTGNYRNIRDSIHYIAENKVLSIAIDRNSEKNTGSTENGILLSGPLLYKRIERKSMFQPKIWKTRYFAICNRVLHCYHDPDYSKLLRALPLQDCEISIEGSSKYEHYFEVSSALMNMKFLLRAEGPEQFEKWTTALKCESALPVTSDSAGYSTAGRRLSAVGLRRSMTNGSSAGVSPAASLPVEESSFNVVPELSPSEYSEQVDLPEEYSPSSNEVILSAAQEKRYEFFKSQKQFIRNLTDICDRLRFVEKPCRKDVLQKAMEKLVVPAFCYLPLCKSTDPWRYILQALPEEGHAFTTKARVPALMFFEVEEHPEAMDVASFLALELQEYVTGTDEDVELQRASEDFAANPTRNDTILPSPPSSDSTPRSIGLGSRTSSEERRKSLLVKSTSGASLDSFSSVPPGMERSTSNASAASSNSVAKMVSGESSPMLPKRGSIWKDSLETSAPPAPVSLPSTSAEEEIGVGGGETFEGKSSRIRYVSPYGHLNSWKLDGVLAKSNDDVRQEVFVMQLITYYDRIFKNDKVDVWLHPYRIVSTSKTTGLIQLIPDAMSIDGLKKLDNYPGSLKDYFKMIYKYDVPSTGEEGSNHPLAEYFPKNSSVTYMNAIHAYLQSMAAYSVVTYLIAIKDRHNGNIMIDSHGHVIHIDYGFVFGLAPGKKFSMEKAPWKLTKELVDLMVVEDVDLEDKHAFMEAPLFKYFKNLVTQCLISARKHANEVSALMKIMCYHSSYPAFRYNPNAISDFMSRLMLRISDADLPAEVDKMMLSSYDHFGTNSYDHFQVLTNGIAK